MEREDLKWRGKKGEKLKINERNGNNRRVFAEKTQQFLKADLVASSKAFVAVF